jgi:hypothetical protein
MSRKIGNRFISKPRSKKPEENTPKSPENSKSPEKQASVLSGMSKKFRAAALGVIALVGADLMNTQEAQADMSKASYEQLDNHFKNKEWDKVYNTEYQELFAKYPKDIEEFKKDIAGSLNVASMYPDKFQPNEELGLGKVPDFSKEEVNKAYKVISEMSLERFYFEIFPALIMTQRGQSAVNDGTAFYKEIISLYETKKVFLK